MAKKKMTFEEKLEEAIVKDAPYEVPDNWIWSNVGSISLEIKNGTTIKQNKDEIGIKVTRIESLQNNGIDLNRLGTIIETEKIKEQDYYIDGDIALSHINSLEHVGKTALIDNSLLPLVHGMNLLRIRVNKRMILPKYFQLYTRGYDYKKFVVDRVNRAVNQVSLNQKNLSDVPMPIPPLKEQQRIVDKIESLFEKLDKAKELIEEVRDDFEKRKSAILEKAFRGELTKEWRKNNSVSIYGVSYLNEISQMRTEIYKKLLNHSKNNKTKRPTKIHDVNLDCIQHEICDTWIKTKLGNVLYDFRYGTSSKSDYSFDGMPVIRIPNLSNGYINHEDMKYLKENDIDMNNKVKSGDLVIIRSNGSASLVGKTSLITESEDDFAFASYLIRMRPCKVDSKYLYYVLNSISVKEQFYSKSKSTSGINNINTEELGNSIISLPPLEEQKEIVRILDKLLEEESKIEELTQLEEQIELIKKSILAKAFRGQLGTNSEDDESAIELLKEILNK